MSSDPSHPVPQPLQPKPAAIEDQVHRERFDGHELAIVLSHYDLGVIEQLRAYPRGSRRSPKLRIRSKRGEFLLKRRASGQDDPYRVAFAHDLQLRLADRGYPVAGLIGTREDNNSMVQFNGRTYELFHFVHGTRYDGTPKAALEAGDALGRLHRYLAEYRSAYEPPVSSFHAVPEIDAKMALMVPAVITADRLANRQALVATVEYLRQAYHDAAKRVNDLGFASWPKGVLHGDWHPGNLLYRDGQVAAVLDFDSSRLEPRIVDLANGALQFSIQMGAPDQPQTWPDSVDANLIRCLLRGYDQAEDQPTTPQERQALPWLMIEALIIESIVPIAATGSFARIPGAAFLQMVERKVRWLRPRAQKLIEFLNAKD